MKKINVFVIVHLRVDKEKIYVILCIPNTLNGFNKIIDRIYKILAYICYNMEILYLFKTMNYVI